MGTQGNTEPYVVLGLGEGDIEKVHMVVGARRPCSSTLSLVGQEEQE